jgi:hypothetical protein
MTGNEENPTVAVAPGADTTNAVTDTRKEIIEQLGPAYEEKDLTPATEHLVTDSSLAEKPGKETQWEEFKEDVLGNRSNSGRVVDSEKPLSFLKKWIQKRHPAQKMVEGDDAA